MSLLPSLVPTSSPHDDRKYRVVKLPNELQAILVSDSTTDKAAAAVSVCFGQFSDPDNLLGLAHFLEHMLFLGTEAYPDENEYAKFLNNHGGSSNAYTAQEETNYYFDVGADHLKEALDIFSHFFKDPLFTPSATEREMNAVNSEYLKNLQDDGWRMFQLIAITSWKGHPYARFGIGNLKTLSEDPAKAGINVRDALLAFHARHYSANAMKLSIIGKESLDELEALAVSLFSGVVNRNVTTYPSFTPPDAALSPPSCLPFCSAVPTQFRVVPVKDRRTLSVAWGIPSLRKAYKATAASYLSFLFGHEGEGSLLSVLKKRGWANALSAGASLATVDFELFTVDVDLTEDGLDHVDDIMETVFAYRALVDKEGIVQRLFDELSSLGRLKFTFAQKSEPMEASLDLAHRLHLFEPEDVLTGDHYPETFDPALIRSVLSQLSPSAARLFIESNTFAGTTTEIESWFGVQYSREEISSERLARWNNPSAAAAADLAIPPPNPYVPTDTSLLPSSTKDGADVEAYAPSLISASGGDLVARTYYKADRTYGLPHAVAHSLLFVPGVYSSPKRYVTTELVVAAAEDLLNENAYTAELAGLHLMVKLTGKGIQIHVSGYNDKLGVLQHAVVNQLVAVDRLTPERFAALKNVLEREYQDLDLRSPYEVAHSALYDTVYDPYCPAATRAAAVKDVTLEDVIAESHSLRETAGGRLLVIGNIGEETAREWALDVQGSLALKAPVTSSEPSLRLVMLSAGEALRTRVAVANPEEPNSAVVAYFQVGPLNHHDDVANMLVCQMMTEPAFDTLRTNEQLGYIVYAGSLSLRGIIGIRVLVQSAYKAEYVDGRIHSFIQGFEETLKDMSDEEFTKHKEALETIITEKDKTLGQEADRLWAEIEGGYLEFDRVQKQVETLHGITKADAVAFFTKNLSNATTRRLYTAYVESSHATLPEAPLETTKFMPSYKEVTEEERTSFGRRLPLWPVSV